MYHAHRASRCADADIRCGIAFAGPVPELDALRSIDPLSAMLSPLAVRDKALRSSEASAVNPGMVVVFISYQLVVRTVACGYRS